MYGGYPESTSNRAAGKIDPSNQGGFSVPFFIRDKVEHLAEINRRVR